jgi:hypothetical protein
MQILSNYSNYNNYYNYNYDYAVNNQSVQDNDSVSGSSRGCDTCDNRQYMDKSADGTVSMQTPTKMKPTEAAHGVIAHEMEHIRNDRQSAEAKGNEVVYQSVRLHYDVCRECGISYVAGGEATTAWKSTPEFNNGAENAVGDLLDARA